MDMCQFCSADDTDMHAVMYCRDCHKCLCMSCLNTHNLKPGFGIHRLSEVNSIRGCEFSVITDQRKDYKGPIIQLATDNKGLIIQPATDYKGPIIQPVTDYKGSIIQPATDYKGPIIPPATHYKGPIIQPATHYKEPITQSATTKFKCCTQIKMDDENVYISGIGVTDDNRIILCNTRSRNLHIYTEFGEHVQHITLYGEPWDIAIIPGGKKAVLTLSTVPAVQFIDLTPVQAGKLLPLPSKCYGIAVINNCLILGGKGIIYVVNNHGQVLSTINPGHHGYVWYIHPGQHNTLYHTSYDFNQVSCIGLVDRCQYFKYESTSLTKTWNVEAHRPLVHSNDEKSSIKHKRVYEEETLGGPEAIASDGSGNLYVACRESSSICRLSARGEFQDLAFTKKDGIRRPYVIAFFNNFTKLAVSNNDGEIVIIFQIDK